MRAESLDILEKADLPPQQARAIVRAIEIEIGGARDRLATKDDVHMLRQEIQTVRQDLTQDIHAVRDDLGRDIHALDIKIESVRTELHSTASHIVRRMSALIFGSMATVLTVVLGVVYFLFTHPPH